jgi:hypothetical protein
MAPGGRADCLFIRLFSSQTPALVSPARWPADHRKLNTPNKPKKTYSPHHEEPAEKRPGEPLFPCTKDRVSGQRTCSENVRRAFDKISFFKSSTVCQVTDLRYLREGGGPTGSCDLDFCLILITDEEHGGLGELSNLNFTANEWWNQICKWEARVCSRTV